MTLRRRLIAMAVLIPVVSITLVGAAQYYVLRVYLLYQTAASVSRLERAAATTWRYSAGDLETLPVAGSATALYRTTPDGLPIGRPSVALYDDGTGAGWIEPPFRTYPHLLHDLPRGLSAGGPGVLGPGTPRSLYRVLTELRVVPPGTYPSFVELPGRNGDVLLTAYRLSGDQVLVLETPLTPVEQQLRAELAIFALASCAALIVIVVLAFWLTSRALSPLKRVARVADEISGGACDRRTGLGGSDEVARLTSAFDGMVDRLQEQMRRVSESEAEMRRFLTDASHELRTPVTGILGHLEVLQRGAMDDRDDLRQSLSAMHVSADRLARMVHDLLSLSRLEQGEMAVAAEPVDISSAVAGAVAAAAPSTARHLVDVAPLDGALTVVGDRDAVERILVNLLENAAKYSPPGGAIEVAARRAGESVVEVLVSDRGPGIALAEQERIFERFSRGAPVRSRDPAGGAGLGLAISRGLARRQGGDLTVRSAPGQGSVFTLHLPASTAPLATTTRRVPDRE